MKRMPRGVCAGCGDESDLPPFADGMCFLCATDGPPGSRTPTGGALPEGLDARRYVDAPSDEEIDRWREILAIFEEAQGRTGAESLGANYADRFCFSRTPNAPTKARWLNRHPRPEPKTPRPARVKPARKPAVVREVVARSGPKMNPKSALSRVVAHVVAHPGATIRELALAIGIDERTVSRRCVDAQRSQRLLRVGAYGDARFYPGPRATEEKTPPVRAGRAQMVKLACKVAEPVLKWLEEGALREGSDLGVFVERLVRPLMGPRVSKCEETSP